MQNPFQNLRLESLKVALQDVCARFPLSVLLVLIITSLGIYNIAFEGQIDTHMAMTLFRVIVTCVITFFLSVGAYLLGESYGLSRWQRNLLQIVSLAFAVGFYFTLNTDNLESTESLMSIVLSLAGFLSFLFIAPFVKRMIERVYNQDAYYSYFYQVSLVFLISSIVGWALMLLGFVAIGSIFELFDLSTVNTSFFHEEKIFGYWAVLSLAFVSPLFGLVHIPASDSFDDEKVVENAFFTWMVRYIGISFIYIYFLILYAYSIKVLMNFGDWPKGQISWMVIGFSVFGYLIYIFSYSLKGNTLISTFRKYFPFAVLPQILMLFYAIYLRINQYDITINRYFVVAFGLFLLIISLYYSFSKRKYLGFIPGTLAIIIILISVGPWSVYSLPESRQYDRLVTHLEKAQILKNGTITPLKEYSDIDAELSNEIYERVDYTCDLSECSKVKALFPKEVAEAEIKSRKAFEESKDLNSSVRSDRVPERVYAGISKWEIVEAVTSAIKVRRSNSYATTPEYLSFRIDYKEYFPIALENYQYITDITSTEFKPSPNKALSVTVQNGSEVVIKKGDAVMETLSMKNAMDALMAKNNGIRDVVLPKNDLTFEIVWEKYRVKLFFQNISVRNPKYTGNNEGSMTYGHTSGYALVSEK